MSGKPIVLVSLGVLVSLDEYRALQEFVEFGVTKLSVFFNRSALSELIAKFRQNATTDEAFKLECGKLFPAIHKMSMVAFVGCWEKMCAYLADIDSRVEQIQRLTQSAEVWFVDEVDAIIAQKIAYESNKWIDFSKEYAPSAQSRSLDKLLDQFRALEKGRVFYLIQPSRASTYAWLGPFRWVFRPFQTWVEKQRGEEAERASKLSTDRPFLNLVKLERGKSIAEALEDALRKVRASQEYPDAEPSFTPYFSAHGTSIVSSPFLEQAYQPTIKLKGR